MGAPDEPEDTEQPDAADGERPAASQGPANSGGRLDAAVQEQLGQLIKAMYDDVAKSPVPDRFMELLAELERKEKRS